MLHKVSTVGVVNLTNAIGHPINILTRVVAYRLNRAVSVTRLKCGQKVDPCCAGAPLDQTQLIQDFED